MSYAMNVTLDHTVVPTPGLLFCDAGGEAVILSEATGQYYGLNGTGMRFWQALESDGRLAAAYRTVLDEYEVAPDELERDLLSFVQALAARRLVTVAPGS